MKVELRPGTQLDHQAARLGTVIRLHHGKTVAFAGSNHDPFRDKRPQRCQRRQIGVAIILVPAGR